MFPVATARQKRGPSKQRKLQKRLCWKPLRIFSTECIQEELNFETRIITRINRNTFRVYSKRKWNHTLKETDCGRGLPPTHRTPSLEAHAVTQPWYNPLQQPVLRAGSMYHWLHVSSKLLIISLGFFRCRISTIYATKSASRNTMTYEAKRQKSLRTWTQFPTGNQNVTLLFIFIEFYCVRFTVKFSLMFCKVI